MKSKKVFWAIFIGMFFFVFTQDGFAQSYPTKPIRIVVPHGSGGSADLVTRMMQKLLGKELNTPIVVENIPAGNTKMGAMEVMKAQPDGYTLMVVAYTVLIGYYYSGTYDFKTWEKLTIIASMQDMPYGLFEVRADSPFKTWADLVKYAKENPGKLTCGGPGAGGVQNLNVIQASKAAGITVKYVPFPGGGPSGVALLGGHVDFRICLTPEAYPNIRAGRTRGLAVAYATRLPEMPDVPTFKELGLMDVIPPLSYDLWGPPNMPEKLVNQISKAVEKAVKYPEFNEFCKQMASQAVFKDAQKMKENMKYFDEKVGPLLAAAFPRN